MDEVVPSERDHDSARTVLELPGMFWWSAGPVERGFLSERWLRFTGAALDDAIGLGWLRWVHPDDLEGYQSTAEQAAQAGHGYDVEYRLRHHDGRYRWIYEQAEPRFGYNAQFLGFSGLCLDTSARPSGRLARTSASAESNEDSRARDLLAFSIEAGQVLSSSLNYEATLRNLTRLAVPRLADWCIVHLLDEQGRLEEVNLAHADPNRIAWVRDIAASYRPRRGTPPLGPLQVARSGKSQFVPEFTNDMIAQLPIDDEGKQILHQIGIHSYMCIPIKRQGESLGAITFVAAESKRRFGDADLRTAEHLGQRAGAAIDNALLYREAERERARFSSIIAAIGPGVCQVDADGRIEYVNPAGASLLGLRADDLTGLVFHDLVHTSPAQAFCDSRDCPILTVLSSGQTFRGQQQFRSKLRSAFEVDVHCRPMLIDQEVTGAVVVFEDITERLEAERRKDDFLAFASHELRNPLTPIIGFSRWLSRDLQARPAGYTDQMREAVDVLKGESERMAKLVEVFLDLSRIESNRLAVDLGPVDLRHLVRNEVDAIQSRFPGAHIRTELPSEADVVLSDEVRLRQVLVNLLENAAKYGGEPPDITVRLEARETETVFSVRDQGPGIPPEDHPRIFERFFRSTSQSKKKGLGVGLFLTREIVEQLGGHITFVSRTNEGTEFTVTLPRTTGLDGTL